MQFELMFSGRIPSSNGKLSVNFAKNFRRQLHTQMTVLWDAKPLSDFAKWRKEVEYSETNWEGAAVFERHRRKYVALVNERLLLAVRMELHFYDPEGGLDLKSHIVDVDNRLKVLLDLLRMPDNPEHTPEEHDPHFCLLQDDRLVWGIGVERHRLFREINGESYFTRMKLTVVPSKTATGNASLFGVEVH